MYSLKDIQFPIYVVGTEQPTEIDNRLVFESRNTKDELIFKVLDDKNIDAPTLAARRLILQSQSIPLKSLNKAVFFIQDMLKISTPKTWFIDSSGFLFKHIKKKRVPLLFKPIRVIIPIQTGGAIIEVEGLEERFKTLFAPTDEKYAGILKIGRVTFLYGLYFEKPSDTWRLV